MPPTSRLNVQLRVSPATADTIRRLARERNVAHSGLFLQALGVLQVIHDAAKEGKHVGISPSRDCLETVLLDAVI